ncbi:P-II family nitrogen regulator [Chloroflexota bacterium]
MPINSGDTAWLLVSTALVMLMTPGLALFYGGMVRRKNLLSTLMMSFVMLGLVAILWVLYAYSLAFGPDKGGITLQWRAGTYRVDFLPQLKLEIVVDDSDSDTVVDNICKTACTGKAGDFIHPLSEVVRVRTREKGGTAI